MNDTNLINDIFSKHLDDAFEELVDNKIICKKVLLKTIVNNIINQKFGNEKTQKIPKVVNFFSGRGNSWVMFETDTSNVLWNKLSKVLDVEKENDKFFEFSSYKDLFEEKGFAWLKYSHVSSKHVQFHFRYNGSKNNDHIKLNFNFDVINSVKKLEGVPHKLNLETGEKLEKTKLVKRDLNEKVDSNEFFTNIDDILK